MGFHSDMGDAHLLAVAQLGKQLTSLEILANKFKFKAKVSPQGLTALKSLSGLQRFRCPGARIDILLHLCFYDLCSQLCTRYISAVSDVVAPCAVFGVTIRSNLSQLWTDAWMDTLESMVDGGLRSLTLHASSMKTALVHGISQVPVHLNVDDNYDAGFHWKQHMPFPKHSCFN